MLERISRWVKSVALLTKFDFNSIAMWCDWSIIPFHFSQGQRVWARRLADKIRAAFPAKANQFDALKIWIWPHFNLISNWWNFPAISEHFHEITIFKSIFIFVRIWESLIFIHFRTFLYVKSISSLFVWRRILNFLSFFPALKWKRNREKKRKQIDLCHLLFHSYFARFIHLQTESGVSFHEKIRRRTIQLRQTIRQFHKLLSPMLKRKKKKKKNEWKISLKQKFQQHYEFIDRKIFVYILRIEKKNEAKLPMKIIQFIWNSHCVQRIVRCQFIDTFQRNQMDFWLNDEIIIYFIEIFGSKLRATHFKITIHDKWQTEKQAPSRTSPNSLVHVKWFMEYELIKI